MDVLRVSKEQLVRNSLSKFHFIHSNDHSISTSPSSLSTMHADVCLWWCCVNMCHVNFTWSRWTDSDVRRYGILSICIDFLRHPRLIGRTTQLACEQPRRTDSKVSHISSVCLCHWWTC